MKKHNYLLDGIILFILIIAGIIGFIRLKTGFSYNWNWGAIPQFFFKWDSAGHLKPNLLMLGFFTTIKLSFWSSLAAIIIGTLMGILRTRKNLFSRLTGRTYIEIARNTPPLVLVFIFYFFIGNNITAALGIDEWARNLSVTGKSLLSFLFSKPERFSEFLSALFTLAVYEGAYVAEIIRGGLESIEKGQFEASDALGMTSIDKYRFVVLPQVFRKILPSLTGQAISTIKDSSIVSIISIQELTFQGMELMASTYLVFEIWITITVMYFVLTISLSTLASVLEKRMIMY
ncbi:MAG: amino acid ABC transporter permease [Bacteroidetes bacterium]|nr:MAG: amino acid ABC transporter permease [Bacteroidota bacterium]